MTNVIVGMTISIDGFVADASGSSDRLYTDLAVLRAVAATISGSTDPRTHPAGEKHVPTGNRPPTPRLRFLHDRPGAPPTGGV